MCIRVGTLTLEMTDRSAIVPSGLGQKAGLCPDHVQVSDRYGGGFPANVEGLHHLHCLVRTLMNNLDSFGNLYCGRIFFVNPCIITSIIIMPGVKAHS